MIRFALLGCGRIANKHASILGGGQVPEAKLSAVCDTDLSRAKKYGEKYGVPYFDNLQQMMNSLGDEIDVVNVLTPSGSHAQDCLQVVKYKKHIVVEKPMALTLDDADKIIAACKLAKIKLFVVKQNRYNLPVLKLKEAMQQGRFGKLVTAAVRVRWCRDQEYYNLDDWRGTWAMDGGVFANQASHHVDLMEWLMGDVVSVYAKSITALVDIETEDTGVAILKFKSGALGIIEATTATRPKDLEGSISILGEKGSVEIGGFAVNEMKLWSFDDVRDGDDGVLERYKENPPNIYGFGHVRYLEHVVADLKSKDSVIVNGEDGRKSLEVIAAIYESIETGKEVFLPLASQNCRLGKSA